MCSLSIIRNVFGYVCLFVFLCNEKKVEKFTAAKLTQHCFLQPKRLVMISEEIYELIRLTSCSRLSDV